MQLLSDLLHLSPCRSNNPRTRSQRPCMEAAGTNIFQQQAAPGQISPSPPHEVAMQARRVKRSPTESHQDVISTRFSRRNKSRPPSSFKRPFQDFPIRFSGQVTSPVIPGDITLSGTPGLGTFRKNSLVSLTSDSNLVSVDIGREEGFSQGYKGCSL